MRETSADLLRPRYRPTHRRGGIPLIIVLLGTAAAAVWASLFAIRPPVVRELELIAYDSLLRAMQREAPPTDVIVVDIDEASLERRGQWPWPRYLVADLLDKIASGSPKAIGVDILFAEPDRLSLGEIQNALEREKGVKLNLDEIPSELYDNDQALAKVLAYDSLVTGVWFSFDNVQSPSAPCVEPDIETTILRVGDDTGPIPVATAQSVKCPTLLLRESATRFGFLNSLPDADGRIRRNPLLISYYGKLYPSLALAVVSVASGTDRLYATVSPGGVESVRFGQNEIPTDPNGNMLLRFSGPGRHCPHVSAIDILESRVSPDEFRGKVIFVGSSAAALKDVQYTPYDKAAAGVEIHALAADMMLRGEYIRFPGWAAGAQWIVALLVGVFVALGVARLSPIPCGILVLGFAALCWFASQWLLTTQHVFVSPNSAIAANVGNFTILAATRIWYEQRRALRIARGLSMAQSYAISALTALAETRDPETGSHILRTQLYVKVLALRLRSHPRFRGYLDAETVDLLPRCAPLHDIGKIGVPDRILLKPERLTDQEFAEMKKHTIYGFDALRRAREAAHVEEDISFIQLAQDIAISHHEKWDGTGYPYGLRGEDIPVAGRLMALADVYDAVRSKRCYKEAMTHAEAVSIIREGSGKHFDVDVVEAFIADEGEFQSIAERYEDREEG